MSLLTFAFDKRLSFQSSIWCWHSDSLRTVTVLFPVKSFTVSSLLDYPVVADAFRQSNTTMLSFSSCWASV